MRINQSNTNQSGFKSWWPNVGWTRSLLMVTPKTFLLGFSQILHCWDEWQEDNLCSGTGNWLIFLDCRNLFNLRVHWCILAFLCVLYIKVYKCRPSCISYFLRSRGYVFLTHRAGGMGEKKNFTLFAFSWKSLLWPLFFPGLNGRTGFLPRRQ